jgi:hypothetical protein
LCDRIAGQRPDDIAFVITPGAPSRGTAAHPSIRSAAESVRARILTNHGDGLLPACYTGHCTCDFVDSLQRRVPASVVETTIYTCDDGVVHWHFCKTDNDASDANRLAQARCAPRARERSSKLILLKSVPASWPHFLSRNESWLRSRDRPFSLGPASV